MKEAIDGLPAVVSLLIGTTLWLIRSWLPVATALEGSPVMSSGSVVHYTVQEQLGVRYTACSRVDPRYSTACFEVVTCEPCKRRVHRLEKIPPLNQMAEMREWVQKARRDPLTS
jgi:PHP family Zn ribbon phosphoesterase